VNELPEVVWAPQLKPALEAINGAATIFRSFGCNYDFIPGETTESGPPLEGDGEPQTSQTADVVESYLHVGFADLARCANRDDYYRLCGRLTKHLCEQVQFQANEQGDDNFDVDLGIESVTVNGEDQGHVLAITCYVWGWSEAEARERWGQLMGVIANFLAVEQLI
jgi:hypothetical protein